MYIKEREKKYEERQKEQQDKRDLIKETNEWKGRLIKKIEVKKKVEKEKEMIKARYESLKLLHNTSRIKINKSNNVIKSLRKQ